MTVKLEELFKLYLDEIHISSTTCYGNKIFGNNKDGVHYATQGKLFRTYSSFSAYYKKTGYVVKGHEDSKTLVEGIRVFKDGEFIEMTIYDGMYEYKEMKKYLDIFHKLLIKYEVVLNEYTHIADSGLIRNTVTLKYRS